MPHSSKVLPSGAAIDFHQVFELFVAPVLQALQLRPFTIFGDAQCLAAPPGNEHAVLADLLLVDIAALDASGWRQLGVRSTVRPGATVLMAHAGEAIVGVPESLSLVRYDAFTSLENQRSALQETIERLFVRRENGRESVLFDLLIGSRTPDVPHQKTDVFRDRVSGDPAVREALRKARTLDASAIEEIERNIGEINQASCATLVDLLLSYRAVSAWDQMIVLVDKMPSPLAATLLVREQLAFALNRLRRREEAAEILLRVIAEYGPNPESSGLLGRVYKDSLQEAINAGDMDAAQRHSMNAIDAYLQGFDADWRDAYPGINAITLMELYKPQDPRRLQILPVVRYAVIQKVARTAGDYWDYATLLELAVLASDQDAAEKALFDARQMIREQWEPETTVRNLELIRQARASRSEDADWIAALINQLRHGNNNRSSKAKP